MKCLPRRDTKRHGHIEVTIVVDPDLIARAHAGGARDLRMHTAQMDTAARDKTQDCLSTRREGEVVRTDRRCTRVVAVWWRCGAALPRDIARARTATVSIGSKLHSGQRRRWCACESISHLSMHLGW